MMCRDLSEELFYFDLRKEQELQQVFLEFAAAQLARHEKVGTKKNCEYGILIGAFTEISGLAPCTVARQMVRHAVLARRAYFP